MGAALPRAPQGAVAHVGRLVLTLPDGDALDIPLERERTTIGRRPDNDVCLPYPAVSGEHAAVVTILDDSFLEDLNSTNGTLVNGRAVAKHFLRDGDVIDIGRQVLVYRGESRSSAPAGGDESIGIRSPRHPDARQRTGVAPPVSPLSPEPGPGPRSTEDADTGRGSPFAPPPGDAPPLADIDALLSEPDPPGVREARRRRARDLSAPPPAQPVEPSAPSAAVAPDLPRVCVESGPSVGRAVAMTGDAIVIGRVGESIVAVRRLDGRFRLVPLEGDAQVTVNGTTVASDGADLAAGDAFEVAGTTLRFVVPA